MGKNRFVFILFLLVLCTLAVPQKANSDPECTVRLVRHWTTTRMDGQSVVCVYWSQIYYCNGDKSAPGSRSELLHEGITDCCNNSSELVCGDVEGCDCQWPETCSKVVTTESNEGVCRYIRTDYDCFGKVYDQYESEGQPPDGLSCCDSVPGNDDYCPEDQREERPAGSGNYYCHCGEVSHDEREPWRQGMPGPAPSEP